MSKIPYKFRPIPDEFLTNDFLEDPLMMKFIRWIMQRVSPDATRLALKEGGKQLDLDPFEFKYGKESCSQEAGISEQSLVTRKNQLIGLGFIQKSTSKSTSKYSVYKLLTGSFHQIANQQINTQTNQQPNQQPNQLLIYIDKKKEERRESKVAAAPPAHTQISLRELVTMKAEEFAKLQASLPVQQLDWMLDKLDFHLSTTTKKRAKSTSCYAYFKKGSWLFSAYEEYQSKASYSSNITPLSQDNEIYAPEMDSELQEILKNRKTQQA